jgi:N utilization substance protein B
MSGDGKAPRNSKGLARSQARLAAVQALYQMDLAETDLANVIDQFKAHRMGSEADDGTGTGAEVDPEHFSRVLKGVVRRQLEIDPLVDQQLAQGWRLTRIDSILRAILRAGAFELIELTDVPPRVIISEYIDVAHAFFEADEPRVVNGVLDALARKLRPGDLPERG